MNLRGALPWGMLAALVIGAIAWTAWPSGEPTQAERARALTGELRCPDCEGLSVADSSTSSARSIRGDIQRRIVAGESDATIRQVYVDRYGGSILLKPEGGGIGVLVWGLPVVVLVLGASGLVLTVRRWRSEPPLHASAADEALVERARTQP